MASSSSSSSSDDELGRSRSDSAYTLHVYKYLHTCPVKPMLATWRNSESVKDFSTRFAAQEYSFPNTADSVPGHFSPPPDQRSMAALAARSEVAWSCNGSIESIPCLTLASTLSNISIRSSEAGAVVKDGCFDEEGQLLEQNDSIPHIPSGIRCLLAFLACPKVFIDLTQWYEHGKTHFLGHSPPSALACPFQQCDWAIVAPDGETAWSNRWWHIQKSHDLSQVQAGQDQWLCDTELRRHLFNEGLIDRAQVKELREHGRLGVYLGTFVLSQSERKHRRRREG